jgi:lactate dehydrogenase-like 2-hydroxyacid dehydrogenase
MKPSAFLVSVAHSGICDEDVLAEMVQRGRLAGVALDVPRENSPLEKITDRSVLTPSTAWYTQDSLYRFEIVLIDTIEKFMAGTPQNLVA